MCIFRFLVFWRWLTRAERLIFELTLARLLNQLLRRKIKSDQRSLVLFKVARCYLKVRLTIDDWHYWHCICWPCVMVSLRLQSPSRVDIYPLLRGSPLGLRVLCYCSILYLPVQSTWSCLAVFSAFAFAWISIFCCLNTRYCCCSVLVPLGFLCSRPYGRFFYPCSIRLELQLLYARFIFISCFRLLSVFKVFVYFSSCIHALVLFIDSSIN